ncbi:RICIN domain-containing protein [Streptomyces sp. MAI_2237]
MGDSDVSHGLKWLGGAGTTTAPDDTLPGDVLVLPQEHRQRRLRRRPRRCHRLQHRDAAVHLHRRPGPSKFRLAATDSRYRRIGGPSPQVIDVTDASGADSAALQLWAYTGGQNRQRLPVKEAAGRYDFTGRHSGKCLTAAATAVNSTQLTQRTCDGSAAQSFTATTA